MTTIVSPRLGAAARRASALYCAVHGHGTPLLLIHGLGASGAIFQPLIDALSPHFQLIIPDLRGHGQSCRLPGPHSTERLADDLVNLLDLLKIRSCYALGHASGGAILQQFARAHRDRLRGMVMVCAFARQATTVREQIESYLRPELFRLLGASTVGALAARRALAGEAAFVRNVIGHNDGRRIAPIARLLQRFDSRSWLHELDRPALVIAGEADPTTPPHLSQELAARLPQAQFHTIPQAGHWLIKTHSAQLLDIVLPWLKQQRSAE